MQHSRAMKFTSCVWLHRSAPILDVCGCGFTVTSLAVVMVAILTWCVFDHWSVIILTLKGDIDTANSGIILTTSNNTHIPV